ncbi:MAG: SusC/RagA family TonB-linked outer membrane protein [Bacteroidaceae bacterium]|nr:SusC/RagA family TonB-linked outer membrane protein [Bacteroidaceae bacterium]MBQ5460715.1 SusC/RagA family TonB-linked outer membrane protein [Bacteroidaceae bacterium]
MKKILAIALLFCTMVQMALAQTDNRISGTVVDDFGPVMMANVVERDANNRIVNATATDANGNFSMPIKSGKNKLVVSFIGNKTQVLDIGNKRTFRVVMGSDAVAIQEVVVKANRTQSGGLSIPVKEISVAQQTMNMEDVEGLAFTSADEALQGEIAGLDIVANSGNLGAGTQMRLRGVTTITGDANPLIVVNDKIFDNPDENFDFQNAGEEEYASLLSVNTQDIQSITVLKDAAATAVWGANGANGVILITTKRGVRGKTRVAFDYKFTGTWQPKGYDLLNGDDYTMMMKEEFYNPSQSSTATTTLAELNYDKSWSEYENWNNNTDWVKAVSQFGQQHSWNLNLTGGGERATFRISAGYDKQSGTIIKQNLDRFTTRLALDYNVSDRIRFSTDFALTYTNNDRNFDGSAKNNLLGKALNLAPNMAIYRQDANGNDTDEYYIMNPSGDPYAGNFSSTRLSAIRAIGNPVAIANEAWAKEKTYRLTPDFTLKYELLGTDDHSHRLNIEQRIDFDIYSNSSPSWYPASLSTNSWTSGNYNMSQSSESNRFRIGSRSRLNYTPHFNNENISVTMMAQYEFHQSKSSAQSNTMQQLPGGITSTVADGYLSAMSSSNSRSADQNLLYNLHASYLDGRYSLGFSIRADGNSKFGPAHKWAYFPGVSLRYNISDEPFMRPTMDKLKVSVLGLRASYGINGRAPSADYLYFNTYSTSDGYYGVGSTAANTASLDALKLDDLRWEKTSSVNLGFNLGMFENKLNFEFDYYYKDTKDLLMQSVGIPRTTGFSSLSWANVGEMTNQGWELNVNARDIIKKGKFSFGLGFNIAQNKNLIKEMDPTVLASINQEWVATTRGALLNRVQLNNPLGSMYGFRYKGTFQYSYDYLENYRKENNLNVAQYEAWINEQLAAGKTFPVVIGADGKVLMTNQGTPQHLVYNYQDGSSTYTFQGGDAMYEDINNDGQINALDIVYIGNSLPKVNGGFNFNFKYGNWSLKARFMYRFGNKVFNYARMQIEKMYDTYNQCSTVNWRWRKDGDDTPMPRAMYGTGYNWQGSDRYIEDGGFVRFQNLQVMYSFPSKQVKKWGLNSLKASLSINNIYCWTKYSGTDPEISVGSWGVATDRSQTPRSKYFTANINIGF